MHKGLVSPRRIVSPALMLLVAAQLAGCSGNRHYVIASTGTVIGVDISKDPEQPTPHAKLGYHRAELAIVPTNRANCDWDDTTKAWKCAPSQCSGNADCRGARDAADVLMEIRYGGIFDTGKSSGIYQRLAVGETAVQQPGASVMFAKNDEGELTPEAAAVAARAVAPDVWRDSVMSASEAISRKVVVNGKVDDAEAKSFFLCVKESTEQSTTLAKRYAGLDSEKFRSQLHRHYPDELAGWVETGCAKI